MKRLELYKELVLNFCSQLKENHSNLSKYSVLSRDGGVHFNIQGFMLTSEEIIKVCPESAHIIKDIKSQLESEIFIKIMNKIKS